MTIQGKTKQQKPLTVCWPIKPPVLLTLNTSVLDVCGFGSDIAVCPANPNSPLGKSDLAIVTMVVVRAPSTAPPATKIF